ncbi:hypothetical protein GCM10010885_05240 [Alicyclobacillus cellulosilyticus]|uniref:Uncharacterized protein n=1 Tax=Alicyclobacillus cellulosilyticus TaxID=1003997 RepID=A0A917K2U2_9BACL|nr:hypothetical protein [Alicyclobacillus cellulosilyticus]GGI98720.1 hypothetical protein GCM10010885_05240 [Alicyclobacillus cellulosilyticus]
MTTRFSLAELAEMLRVPVDVVRAAVDDLAARGELTAESFTFAGRNWRIAPSDVKRIQDHIAEGVRRGVIQITPPKRRVLRKVVVGREDPPSQA